MHIDPKNIEEARDLGERLMQRLTQPFDIDRRPIFISASIGITLFPDDADAVEPLQRNADLAITRPNRKGAIAADSSTKR